MYSRWYNVSVVVLWLSTMGWLVREKVLPPLLVGEPPGYDRIIEARKREPLVGWEMALDGRSLGWALSSTTPLSGGSTEIRSRVHIDSLPLRDVSPNWMHPLLGLLEKESRTLQLDVDSTLTIDSLDRLSRFESAVRFAPLEEPIKIRGTIDGSQLRLAVFTGQKWRASEVRLPRGALPGGDFSPHTQLPGLRSGQTWTVPSYSPLRPHQPIEILQAVVEGTEPTDWGGRTEETWLVVYRSDSGVAVGHSADTRGRLWVRPDGTVLKQQVTIFDCTMTFVRLPDDEAASLSAFVQSNWRAIGKRWKIDEPIVGD